MFSLPYSSKPNRCSLASMLEKDVLESRWDGNRPSYTYQNIIRFILQELFKHDNDRGYLDPKCISVTSGEAKIEQPCNDGPPPRLRAEFISLIKDMLGNKNNLELKHFIKMAESGVTFEKLFHHPLLQSTSTPERYRFPTRAIVRMNDEGSSWRRDYKKFKTRAVDFNLAIKKAIYKVGLESMYKLMKQRRRQRRGSNNTVADVLDVLDVLEFSKNVVNHINEHLKKPGTRRMTEDEIEKELTRMFPTRLIDLYEFLVLHTQISLAFLSRR